MRGRIGTALSSVFLVLATACAPAAAPPPPAAASRAAEPPLPPAPSSPALPAPKPATSPSVNAAASPVSAAPAPSPAARPAAPAYDEAAVAAFYAGKNVRILVGSSAGGGYDTFARTLAPTLGKMIPGNPNVVVENVPGAGGTVMANGLFNTQPKDGTVIGILQNTAPLAQLTNEEGVQFDARAFNWIGSLSSDTDVCVVRSDRNVNTFQELLTREVSVGGTGPTSVTESEPRVFNGLLGTKFKIISGYAGTNEVTLGIERGDIDGRCGWAWSSLQATQPGWVQGSPPFIRVLGQTGLRKHPALPNVPLIIDMARNDEERGILEIFFAGQAFGRPFAAPPGTPVDRVEALRAAFQRAAADPEFLQRAKTSRLEINVLSGAEGQEVIRRMFAQPPERVQRLQALLRSSP